MSTTDDVTAGVQDHTPNGAASRVGPITPPPVLEKPANRRRRGVLALMVLLVVCGGVAAWWGVNKYTDRVAVVAVVNNVAWGETITASDLALVEVAQDPLLTPVPWEDRATLIGAHAAIDLPAGTLMTAKSATRSDVVPGPGKALVGLAVRSSQAPVTGLHAGDEVLIVSNAGQAGGNTAAAKPVPGKVFAVGSTGSEGTRTVDVIVDQTAAADLAAASAAGRVAIVLVPGK